MLALDLDGTILDMQLHLDPRDVAALDRIRSAGVTVVAC
ncbi:MAG: Cof-type HAD-IIB family hydrolase, partial [Chloroflexi bacterium]